MQGDYYSLLGISRYASREAIKRAFRSRLLAAHPDHNPEDHLADEHTRLIVEAYNTLSNPLSRLQYDRSYCSSIPARPAETNGWKSKLTALILQLILILCIMVLTLLILALIIHILDGRTPTFRPDVGIVA